MVRLRDISLTADCAGSAERTAGMGFGEALAALRRGNAATRRGWNGRGQYLLLQLPDEHSNMRSPYIFIVPSDGRPVPWVASQTDLLSEDWQEV